MELTFPFPIGLRAPAVVAHFDVRDEVCLRVGGFRHGQAVLDSDGMKAVAVGVRDGRMWFWYEKAWGASTPKNYAEWRGAARVAGSVKLLPAREAERTSGLLCTFPYLCGLESPIVRSFDVRDA